MIRRRREVTDSQARELLRRLRDLCPATAGLELAPGETVRVSGCLTADLPVERGVQYVLERADGRREVLVLEQRSSAIELRLVGAAAGPDARTLELYCDRFGRVTAPELGARLDLAVCDERSIEHFLRRLVRAALSPLPPAAA